MSERKDDGGPVFPTYNDGVARGVSLRDYFAAKAMQGLLVWTDPTNGEMRQNLALRSYAMADAMLEARKK